MRFGSVPDTALDLLALRLPLPIQSRAAQISDGTRDSTEQLEIHVGKHNEWFLPAH